MKITAEEARIAGMSTRNVSWTDEELKRIICFEKLVLAFLEGKGKEWNLATKPLRVELLQMEDFLTTRGK